MNNLISNNCLSDLIDSIAFNVVLIRAGIGQYDENGIWIEGSFEKFYIKASVQTITGKDLKDLPEGIRIDKSVKIYTTFPLYTSRKNYSADVIIWDDLEYEIHTVFNQNPYGKYYKSIGIKKNND